MVIALPIAFQCNIYRLCTVDQNIIHSIKQIDALWYSATATKTHTKCETSKHDSFSIRRFIRSFVTTVRLKCHPLETVANSKSTIILLSTLTPIINCFNLFIFCVSLYFYLFWMGFWWNNRIKSGVVSIACNTQSLTRPSFQWEFKLNAFFFSLFRLNQWP